MSSEYVIDPIGPDDREGMHDLLHASKLSIEGLDLVADADVLLARRNGRVVGCVALEVYADGALLRSLAVSETERGKGLGIALTNAILDHARTSEVQRVFLLTETAEQFFPRFGFQPIARADVASGVKGSIEFTTVCPESAAVQALSL